MPWSDSFPRHGSGAGSGASAAGRGSPGTFVLPLCPGHQPAGTPPTRGCSVSSLPVGGDWALLRGRSASDRAPAAPPATSGRMKQDAPRSWAVGAWQRRVTGPGRPRGDRTAGASGPGGGEPPVSLLPSASCAPLCPRQFPAGTQAAKTPSLSRPASGAPTPDPGGRGTAAGDKPALARTSFPKAKAWAVGAVPGSGVRAEVPSDGEGRRGGAGQLVTWDRPRLPTPCSALMMLRPRLEPPLLTAA